MKPKYKLVKTKRPDEFYQIKALVDGPWGLVGTLGGFVQSDKNLSQSGTCWIYNTAKVYGNAMVFDDAQIYGFAEVYGDAYVRGNAKVFENAKVHNYAMVKNNAQVYGNAEAYQEAWIYDSAQVYGDAIVSGNAMVFGKSRISGDATISGDARISAGNHKKNPLYIQGTKDSITVCSKNVINVGCQSHSIDFWLDNAKQIGEENNYTPKEIEEYLKYFQFIKSLFK